MANAIKKISVQRGHDVTEYTLVCFGGAAGQHACLVADALGMQTVYIHPLAGVLSAYGIGLADVTAMKQQAVEAELGDATLTNLRSPFESLESAAKDVLRAQGLRMRGSASSASSRSSTRARIVRCSCRSTMMHRRSRLASTKNIDCVTGS